MEQHVNAAKGAFYRRLRHNSDYGYPNYTYACIDYLMRKGSEVVNMLLDEYDYETDIEVQREEAREEGRIEEKSALIRKKLEKGKTISEIADDLENTEENIAHLIEQFHLHIN